MMGSIVKTNPSGRRRKEGVKGICLNDLAAGECKCQNSVTDNLEITTADQRVPIRGR